MDTKKAWIKELKAYGEAFLDFIYPNIHCMTCGEDITKDSKNNICTFCYEKIKFVQGVQYPYGMTYYDRIISVAEYKGPIKKAVKDFKYYDKVYLGKLMANLMADRISQEEIDFDSVVAVPLHGSKEKYRGYNQAHILAKHLSRLLDKEYIKNALIRSKNTEDMNKLTKTKRIENVRDVFEANNKIALKNKHILLVDDVYTTGATADACSQTLYNGGARRITVGTFAKARMKGTS
ncbi:ComF family protein [Serpentinicella sp. ANB-PHB4]|uniref:ComF family protein n=1 Tax=Serpentinicella sp. ANB-PHB4 TaxID=3074076 RepID=UPI002855A0EE|nr:ComF family protein [Serpentinicella sp. ANB-PHB4]MDR5659767.1 ComF family protein [Serpentinicella sp. ANB-PHB4]